MSAISGGGGAGGGVAGQGDPAISTHLDMDETMLGFVGPSRGAGDGAQGGVQEGARQGGGGQGALLAVPRVCRDGGRGYPSLDCMLLHLARTDTVPPAADAWPTQQRPALPLARVPC